MEKVKYVEAAFTNQTKTVKDEELEVRSRKARAVMRALHHLFALKRELSRKAKLSVFKSIFVPSLTYDHDSQILGNDQKMQSQSNANVRKKIIERNQMRYRV